MLKRYDLAYSAGDTPTRIAARGKIMDDREIQVQEIRKMLNMSPYRFVNLLNKTDKHLITSFDEAFWKYQEGIYTTEPYFKREDLDNPCLTVHILDLQDFIKDNPELSTNEACVNLDGAQSIDVGNAQAQIDILKRDNMALQATLQEKNTRITELEQQLAEQRAATSSVNAERWKKSLEAACELAWEIADGERQDWIKKDFLKALANKYSGILIEAENIAWSKMPGSYKNGAGRRSNKPQ